MDNISSIVFDTLTIMNIPYEVIKHQAVYTIDDLDKLNLDNKNEIFKNLFVRDDKRKRYLLIALSGNKRVNLKRIRKALNCRPLSFASEEDLDKYMKLSKGSVSPFGILNDSDCTVEIIFDKDILLLSHIGVHPNDNTATILINPQDLESVIRNHGNSVSYMEI